MSLRFYRSLKKRLEGAVPIKIGTATIMSSLTAFLENLNVFNVFMGINEMTPVDKVMILSLIDEHIGVAERLKGLAPGILEAGELICGALRRGNKILIAGNGGSAADAQHIAAELVGRFERERMALPAIALTTDSSILTAVGNDYGFDHIFSRQIAAFGRPGDVFIGISTSGDSPNIVGAVEHCQAAGVVSIALTGRDGGIAARTADFCIIVPSDVTARIQEMHILIGHLWCRMVDWGIEGNI